MQTANMIQLLTITGSPVQAAGVTVTPQSQALIVRLPFGGLVWHRPAAVLVERAGNISRVPIVDVTRIVQVALFGAVALVFVATVWSRSSRRKESSS